MFIKNKLYYEYMSIVKPNNRIKSKKEYFESHHIIPRSMGGSDEDDNLVLLTAQEHYRCHELLPYFTKGKDKTKMIYAWNMMSRLSSGVEIDQEKYAELKESHSKIVASQWTGRVISESHKKAIVLSNQTRILSDESRYRLGNGNRGMKHTEETKKKISESNKGRVVSKETRRKISLANMGHKSSLKGARLSEETKNKMRKPKGPQKRVKCSKCGLIAGQSWITRKHNKNCTELS